MTVKNEKGLIADHNNKSQITNVSLSTGEIFLALCMILTLLLTLMIAFWLNYKINVIEKDLKSDLSDYKIKTSEAIADMNKKVIALIDLYKDK